ncbi:hypothetical protein [Nevskia sp.]|uniref:acyl-CoA-like ligand-binding transcription factor n=1 Tax=Nevskia sp. TaxID=1929292 RepID=UPI00345802EA
MNLDTKPSLTVQSVRQCADFSACVAQQHAMRLQDRDHRHLRPQRAQHPVLAAERAQHEQQIRHRLELE